MKTLRILILACLLAMPAAAAHASNLLYGPWVHQVDEHGFTVLWVTEKPSLDYVEIAPDDGSPFEAKARSRYYQTSHGRRTTGRYHSVRIEGLEPGTSYRYRVVGQVVADDSNPYKVSYKALRLISPKKRSLCVRTLDASADS